MHRYIVVGRRAGVKISRANTLDNVELLKAQSLILHDASGPFDIIGDVHGMADELVQLLTKLGYVETPHGFEHPAGRKVIFLGDFVDRGPKSPRVLQIAMDMVEAGNALAVRGNHDDKFVRLLGGRPVSIDHGLERTVAQFEKVSLEFRDRVFNFLNTLPYELVLNNDRLSISHAGLPPVLQALDPNHPLTKRARSAALYGITTGVPTGNEYPMKIDWSEINSGRLVVFGHTPVTRVEKKNGVVDIDTGAVFGGQLSAYRYPEHILVSVDCPEHDNEVQWNQTVPMSALTAERAASYGLAI